MEQTPQITTETIKKDAARRENEDKLVQNKFEEISAVKERLYNLRYDYSRPKDEIILDVKNLCQELNRLEDEVDKLRKDALKTFEASLDLPGLGLELLLTTDALKKKTVNFKEPGESVISLEDSTDIPEHETMEFPPENLKLMRTGSTQSMEKKDAKERWHSLYKMFKEWKHQTSVAEAAQIMKHKDKAPVEDEVIKLRAAIYSLRQRKQLSNTDQKLLADMSNRLADLTRQYA